MLKADTHSFTVERWTPDGRAIEATLCFASHLVIAFGAYTAATAEYPKARLTLRQGVRVIREQAPGESRPIPYTRP